MNVAVRRRATLGVLAFVGTVALRPALAQTSPADTAAPPPLPAVPVTSSLPVTSSRPSPQLTTVHRRRTGLVAGGAIIFGLSWGGAVFLSVAMLNSRCCQASTAADFMIPIVGPVVGGPSHDRSLMLLWSGAQLLGAVTFFYGMMGEDVPVARNAPAVRDPRADRALRRAPQLQVWPMLARDTGGLAVAARW